MIKNYILSRNTTYKIGGPAQYFSVCNSTDDLQDAIIWCKQNGLPWFVIGNGSNILVSDEGFPGLIIKLGKDFKKVIFDENIVEVGGGVLLPALSRYFLAKGWGGFEFMCGIPGTIGGAVRMNAGTRQGEIKDHLLCVKVLSPEITVRNISRYDMDFAYRHSNISNTKDIVVSVRFSLSYMDTRKRIQDKIKTIMVDRRDKQPKIKRNCGSVFKRPPGGKPAGWYIDQAGLKGLRVGDAMVAHEHANWIVNLGNAKATHIKSLIEKIQDKVFRRFEIMFERELIYVPEDIL